LRPDVGLRAGRAEDVRREVVAVGPDAQLRVVEEVRAQVEAVAVPRARRVARLRDGDALVRRDVVPVDGELAHEPAVGELVVEHDGVAGAAALAEAAETAPERADPDWAEQRGARRLVE